VLLEFYQVKQKVQFLCIFDGYLYFGSDVLAIFLFISSITLWSDMDIVYIQQKKCIITDWNEINKKFNYTMFLFYFIVVNYSLIV